MYVCVFMVREARYTVIIVIFMETPQTKHPLNKMFTCVCVCVNFRVFVDCTCVTTGCKDVYALFAMW